MTQILGGILKLFGLGIWVMGNYFVLSESISSHCLFFQLLGDCRLGGRRQTPRVRRRSGCPPFSVPSAQSRRFCLVSVLWTSFIFSLLFDVGAHYYKHILYFWKYFPPLYHCKRKVEVAVTRLGKRESLSVPTALLSISEFSSDLFNKSHSIDLVPILGVMKCFYTLN